MDGDGVGDVCDNCIAIANGLAEKDVPGVGNQTDTDKDGVGDACDNCVKTPNFDQINSDEDSFGDVCDNCRTKTNPLQEDVNKNGIGDACEGLDQGEGDGSVVTSPLTSYRFVGDKTYEFSNHLGNVLSVITDRPLFAQNGQNYSFNPDVLSFSDYYPFGMLVPNRHGSSDSYRYGFQGQEKDDELKGEGNSLNYTFRMHDPRVGRFFTIDPLTHKYPFYSPYHFSSNSPIMSVELEGLETSTLVKEKEKAIKETDAVKTWLGLRILDFIEGFINVGRLTQGKPILKYPILQASSEENLGAVKSVYNTTFEVMSVWQTAKYGIGGENDEI
nr:RHS repeat-associated core domain-containing protein [Flavobacterium sp. UGB4466]